MHVPTRINFVVEGNVEVTCHNAVLEARVIIVIEDVIVEGSTLILVVTLHRVIGQVPW